MSRKTEKNGALPEGWRRVRLGEVYNISASGDFDAKESSRTQNEKHPYPVYSNALTNKGLHSYSTYSRYDEDSITITARGDIGFANHRKTKFMAIGRLLVLKNKIPVSNEFVCEYINHSIRFFKETTGVAQLTVPQASKYYITLPPFPDQKAIASLLAKWDAAVEKTEALIAAKEKQFKWLLKRLIRDQQGNHKWRKVRLGELGAIHSGGTPSTRDSSNWNGDIFWLTPSEVTKLTEKYIDSTKRQITRKGLSHTTLLPKNCLIVCTRATIGDCCINTVPMAINQGFKCIQPHKCYSVTFLYYTFQLLKARLVRLSCGNTFGEVSKKDFANILISVPPLFEQEAIAAYLNAVQQEIIILKQLAEQYRNQKHGLMQKLLAGKWRIQMEVNKQ